MYPDTFWAQIAPTIQYNKYAISGNHMMFVLAGYVDETRYPDGLYITDGTELSKGGMETWMLDKLYPWFKRNGALVGLAVTKMVYDTNWGGAMEQANVALLKWSNTNVHLKFDQTFTIKGGYRVQIDFIVE